MGACGIDVSSWQHPGGAEIDWWAAATDGGVTFALVKITQGVGYVNPWGRRDLEDASAAGMLVGAYHYLVIGDDPTAQAQHCVAELMGLHLELGVWLDVEPPPMEPWALGPLVTAWLQAVHEARPEAGVYCDESTLATLRQANVQLGRLWLAAPGDHQPGLGEVIWQRGTVETPGFPTPVDEDVLVATRGINLPTHPGPRPGRQVEEPVRPPEEDRLRPEEQPPGDVLGEEEQQAAAAG